MSVSDPFAFGYIDSALVGLGRRWKRTIRICVNDVYTTVGIENVRQRYGVTVRCSGCQYSALIRKLCTQFGEVGVGNADSTCWHIAKNSRQVLIMYKRVYGCYIL